MNSEAADLMDVGQHCARPDCRMRDFLPFTCGACQRTFCSDHRTCEAHACPKAGGDQNTVVVCPLCAQGVRVAAGEDANAAFERHSRSDCDPTNYQRVKQKPRCPAGGCRERLTTINSHQCRECGITTCLRHRLGPDHACKGWQAPPAAAAAAQSRLQGLTQSFTRLFSSSSSKAGSKAGSTPAAAAAAGSAPPQRAGSAAARPTSMQRTAAAAAKVKDSMTAQMAQYRSSQRQRSAPAPAAPAPMSGGGGSGAEVCQQCNARFATVAQLIAHAESAHAGGWASGGGLGATAAAGAGPRSSSGGGGGAGQQLERCPHCGERFDDAVQLVAHVERQHAAQQAGSKETCVVC